jgi:hypothetical protein
MNDELERISKEAVVTYSRYPGVYLEGLGKTTKKRIRIAGVPAEI